MTNLRQPYEKILSVAKVTLNHVNENKEPMAKFGVTDELLNTFEADINAADDKSKNLDARLELKGLTRDKDEDLDACSDWATDLKARVEFAFGKKSDEYQTFPAKELADAADTEEKMIPLMDTLIALAQKYGDDLALFGQTPEEITRGTELLEALKESELEQESYKVEKGSDTEDRVIVYQRVYDTTNRLNKIGRLVFKNDPVKRKLFESRW